MPFKAGQSGNPGGMPKGAAGRQRMVRNALVAYTEGDLNALPALAERVWNYALRSDELDAVKWAIEFIADRVDGKPAQAIVGGSEADGVEPVKVAGSLSPAAEELLTKALAGITGRGA